MRSPPVPKTGYRAFMLIFEPASKPAADYREWDARYPEVAREVSSRLDQTKQTCADVVFEHVGSTAVEGCGGKGVIDLLALYSDSAVEDVSTWLLGVGLGRQGPEFARPWSPSRPMYLGWYDYGGERWLVYVHVVKSSSDEVRRFREFKELLRSNADLVVGYCQLKRRIVASGVTDTDLYAVEKRDFFRTALGPRHKLSGIES